MKIIVLGGGLVGGPMAMDLAAENIYEVTVADRDEKVLEDLSSSFMFFFYFHQLIFGAKVLLYQHSFQCFAFRIQHIKSSRFLI
jgi:hypothetical protein